jgi:Protein of unknown function (DUF3800)
MRVFFDESGDYGFVDEVFDCYVQAALICPDSVLPSLESFVDDRRREWSVDELHASELLPDQLHEVAVFLAEMQVELTVQLTDTNLAPRASIEAHRLSQADAYARSLKGYRGESTEVIQSLSRRIKQAGLSSQISDSEFVQATLLFDGLHQAIQRCLYAYSDDKWREAFAEFRFQFDGKAPGKRSAGEKYLADVLVEVMAGSSKYRLDRRAEWSDEPVHPFVARFSTGDGLINLDVLFEHGLQFQPSHEHPGLQLADAVAYMVRQAALYPTDERMAQYALLTRRLADRYGRCVMIARYPGEATRDPRLLQRYAHVAMGSPRDELAGPRR